MTRGRKRRRGESGCECGGGPGRAHDSLLRACRSWQSLVWCVQDFWFYGDDFTFVFVFYAVLGSTADTCTASVYGAAHHLRVVSAIRAWLWYVYGLGSPSLEREVQWDVRVHSSSCGAHVLVVHKWFYHRRHCNWRDLVLFVGRLLWLCGPFVLQECLRRDVVWWWIFHSLWCLRFCLGQCEADDWKFLLQLFPVPRVRRVCVHAELLVQQQGRYLPRQLQLFPVQVEGQVSQ